ncbi:MAG: PIN domain-containing protein [Gemmatales bacterium]
MPDMRKSFPAHVPLGEDELHSIWDNAIIVFDTNTWLNLYIYSDKVATEFRNLQTEFKSKIWIPFRVVEEFMRNRLSRINEAIGIKKALNGELGALVGQLRRLSEHELLTEDEHETVEKAIKKKQAHLDYQIEALKGFGHEDIYTNIFMNEFSHLVGEEYDFNAEELKIAKERSNQGLPPGDRDEGKQSDKDRFGDYIIWKEILSKGRDSSRPLIFVSMDGTAKNKSGWFYKSGEMNVGAHPFLVKEYFEATGFRCIFYTPEQFMHEANMILEIQVASDDLIKETADIAKESDELWIRRSIDQASDNFRVFTKHAIEQLKAVIELGSLRAYDSEPIPFISNVIRSGILYLSKAKSRPIAASFISNLEKLLRQVMTFNSANTRQLADASNMLSCLHEIAEELDIP